MIGKSNIHEILEALDKQIGLHGGEAINLVVCGGTALAVLDLVQRTTRDVDVLGIAVEDLDGLSIQPMIEFPDWFQKAASIVQRDFHLPDGWINTGPASQVQSGLPVGIERRLVAKTYGGNLKVYYLGREDQIHFKLYASIDSDAQSYHVEDLLALKPTDKELEDAARWSLTQDVSEAYRGLLLDFLRKYGYGSVAECI